MHRPVLLIRPPWLSLPLFSPKTATNLLSNFSFLKSSLHLLCNIPPIKRTYSSTPKPPTPTPTTQEHQHHDENTFYEHKTKALKEWEEKSGKKGYAVHQPVTHTIEHFREEFGYLKNGEKASDREVSVSGESNLLICTCIPHYQ
jgi:hypothetical protein